MSFFKKLFGSEPEPDTKGASPFVRDLMSLNMGTRQAALGRALQAQNAEALEAVEDAICRLTGKKDITFYRPSGMHIGSPQEACDQIIALAKARKFSEDPALVQSLIPGVAFLNEDLMQQLLRIDARALAIYQLLGVQMQLKIYVG